MSFIYGKNDSPRIVGSEVFQNSLYLFTQTLDGKVHIQPHKHQYWVLTPDALDAKSERLEGDLHYKYIRCFDNLSEYLYTRKRLYGRDFYVCYDEREAAQLLYGYTYFKDLKPSDVSVLAFDIEATTLEHNADARVLLISNTFRNHLGQIERKLFAYSDYENDGEMFTEWCEWVRAKDPSIVLGHNIYSYDLPYMAYCARRSGTSLNLGRNMSAVQFPEYQSTFRKDGINDYKFSNARIWGREIVDTMFLSIKYDTIHRKYESYALKKIIAQEGLEVAGRQFYDASKIRTNYQTPSEWELIRKYAEHDADDALALFDLMTPAYFYLSRSIPKPFQQVVNSASGAQINSFLVRSYLQEGHSIPQKSQVSEFEGAISIGNPGLYHDVFKVDVASLYPSIILEYKIHDELKDPKQNFLKMVEHFTAERLENKRLGKETGDRYYKDLEQAQKIIINSSYGALSTPGLAFNSPHNAAQVTRYGREILETAMRWASERGYRLVNADTDSISISPVAANDAPNLLKDLNTRFPAKIRWEHDGLYPRMLVLKAKNYVLDAGPAYKLKIKGSALKATTKEPALQEFINEIVRTLLDSEDALPVYNKYVLEILQLKDIARWCSKKTVTDSILNPSRTNEAKHLAALQGTEYKFGDKFYWYFRKDGSVGLREQWQMDHDPIKLLEKLYNTVCVFEPVLDLGRFKNYKLKKNNKLLDPAQLSCTPI